ncbi:MAG TPA: hypothetical protein V6D50_05565 [Chroococcales cyanobacterium]
MRLALPCRFLSTPSRQVIWCVEKLWQQVGMVRLGLLKNCCHGLSNISYGRENDAIAIPNLTIDVPAIPQRH